jgi:hypothetical protein
MLFSRLPSTGGGSQEMGCTEPRNKTPDQMRITRMPSIDVKRLTHVRSHMFGVRTKMSIWLERGHKSPRHNCNMNSQLYGCRCNTNVQNL